MHKVKIKSIVLFFLAVLLTLCCILPTILVPIKFILILIALGLILFYFYNTKVKFFGIFLIFSLVLVGVFGSLHGLLNNGAGALVVMRVMVIYPILFLFFSLAYSYEDNDKLYSLLIFISLILGIFLILFNYLNIYYPSNFLIVFLNNQYQDEAVVDDGLDYFKFTIPTVSSTIFFLPYSIGVLISSKKYRLIALFSLITLVISGLLTGRRALFVTTIIGLIFTLFISSKNYRFKDNKLNRWYMIIILVILIIFSFYFINQFAYMDYFMQRIDSIFDFVNDESNVERKLQFNALIESIKNNPLLGVGAGVGGSYIRSIEQPWAYELSYIALIFQYGILGSLIYLTFTIVIVYKLLKLIKIYGRDSLYFPFLMGMLSFLLANATNPYLGKLDYIWIILLPIFFILKSPKEIK